MRIKFEDLKDKFGKKAKEYANDKEKTQELVNDAINKAKKKGPLVESWDNIQLIFRLVKDWSTGKYTQIPTGSIITIIIGILYFVLLVDLIPDFLPGGLIDDAFVLGLIIKQVRADFDNYKEWIEINKKLEDPDRM